MHFEKKISSLLCLDMHNNFQLKKSLMDQQIFSVSKHVTNNNWL